MRKPKLNINLLGLPFGKWEVIAPTISRANSKYPRKAWLCRCECGTIQIHETDNLIKNKTESCGCWSFKSRYGVCLDHHPLYATWRAVKHRCFRTKNKDFHNYGGRGITVCLEWLNFEVFIAWCLTNNWQPGLTIERIDNDGNYEPRNCRIATHIEQYFNKRNTRFVLQNGVKISLSEICAVYRMPVNHIAYRVKAGWDLNKALTTPIKRQVK